MVKNANKVIDPTKFDVLIKAMNDNLKDQKRFDISKNTSTVPTITF